MTGYWPAVGRRGGARPRANGHCALLNKPGSRQPLVAHFEGGTDSCRASEPGLLYTESTLIHRVNSVSLIMPRGGFLAAVNSMTAEKVPTVHCHRIDLCMAFSILFQTPRVSTCKRHTADAVTVWVLLPQAATKIQAASRGRKARTAAGTCSWHRQGPARDVCLQPWPGQCHTFSPPCRVYAGSPQRKRRSRTYVSLSGFAR